MSIFSWGDDAAKSHVDDVRTSALQTPFDPRTVLPLDPNVPAAAGTLTVNLDGRSIDLVPTRTEITRIVGTCYLLGGFDLVRSLNTAVRQAVDDAQSQAHESQAASNDFVRRLSFTRDSGKRRLYEDAVSRSAVDFVTFTARADLARKIQTLIAASWGRIAIAEEQVLRDYEPLLNKQFAELADKSGRIAKDQWDLYKPYDPEDTAGSTLSIEDAKESATGKLKLGNPGQLIDNIRTLGKSWREYLDALQSTRMVAALGRRNVTTLSPGVDPDQQLRGSQIHNRDAFYAFNKVREQVGIAFPAALQVYGRFGRITHSVDYARLSNPTDNSQKAQSDDEIGSWVIEALINAFNSARALASGAFLHSAFTPDRMRVEPTDDPPPSDLSRDQLRILKEGLTVPATRIIANRIAALDSEVQSPWLQQPVKSKLADKGRAGDPVLAPYFWGGRLHYAALEDVYRAIDVGRKQQKADLDRALLFMDAFAVPLAFFTGGESLVAAGLIHAIVRGREMYMSISDYQAKDALANIALRPMQEAIWAHPSAVSLVSNLIEGGFEIATNVVNEGVAGALLGAIQISLILGHGAAAVNQWAQGGAFGADGQ
jgi:hypothetical protein